MLRLVGYLYYWQMGFNSVFKGLIATQAKVRISLSEILETEASCQLIVKSEIFSLVFLHFPKYLFLLFRTFKDCAVSSFSNFPWISLALILCPLGESAPCGSRKNCWKFGILSLQWPKNLRAIRDFDCGHSTNPFFHYYCLPLLLCAILCSAKAQLLNNIFQWYLTFYPL